MDNAQTKLSIKPLISARNFLANIVQDAQSDYEKAGAIQAFEVCFELVHKILKKVLRLRNVQVPEAVKGVFRIAGSEGLVKDIEVWLEFTDKRNETSHTYDGQVALDILNSLPSFVRELDLLLENLTSIPEIYY